MSHDFALSSAGVPTVTATASGAAARTARQWATTSARPLAVASSSRRRAKQ
jgi:hypothetical protein